MFKSKLERLMERYGISVKVVVMAESREPVIPFRWFATTEGKGASGYHGDTPLEAAEGVVTRLAERCKHEWHDASTERVKEVAVCVRCCTVVPLHTVCCE